MFVKSGADAKCCRKIPVVCRRLERCIHAECDSINFTVGFLAGTNYDKQPKFDARRLASVPYLRGSTVYATTIDPPVVVSKR